MPQNNGNVSRSTHPSHIQTQASAPLPKALTVWAHRKRSTNPDLLYYTLHSPHTITEQVGLTNGSDCTVPTSLCFIVPTLHSLPAPYIVPSVARITNRKDASTAHMVSFRILDLARMSSRIGRRPQMRGSPGLTFYGVLVHPESDSVSF